MSWTALRDLGVQIRPFDGAPPPYVGRWSPFRTSFSKTLSLLARELRMLDARAIALECAYEERDLRIDGYPRANARLTHEAVRLSFTSKWGPLRYETGEYDDWRENLRAIALSMESLRAVDRYGVSKRGEQYAGWKAIAMTSSAGLATAEHARAFLAEWDGDVKRAIRETHPDTGGDEARFRKVMRARELIGA